MSMTDFKCVVCGVEGHFTSIGAATDAGWDWFKGHAPQRLEFCRTCRSTPKFRELFLQSRDPTFNWRQHARAKT